MGDAIGIYQQVLGDVYEMTLVGLSEQATMRVATCHRLADCWQAMNEPIYELRYLKLASELVTPCPNKECKTLICELGCCRRV